MSLTVVTVSFGTRSLVLRNRALTLGLNAEPPVSWIVVENGLPTMADRFTAPVPGVHLVDGIPPVDPSVRRSASLHHGLALNRALREVKTRFALVLDPDFFIVRADWVRLVLRYMQERGLVFFGAPWHPRWVTKWRYFPCAHCLFIDLAKARVDELDFRPETGPTTSVTIAQRVSPVTRVVPRLVLNVLGWTTAVRRLGLGLGGSPDTGTAIYRANRGRADRRSECLVPVFRACDVPSRSRSERLLDRVLPDRLSLVPKRPGYFSGRGFAELGLPDIAGRGWEEFLWRGEPFAFHVRSHRLKGEERPRSVGAVIELLDQEWPLGSGGALTDGASANDRVAREGQ